MIGITYTILCAVDRASLFNSRK